MHHCHCPPLPTASSQRFISLWNTVLWYFTVLVPPWFFYFFVLCFFACTGVERSWPWFKYECLQLTSFYILLLFINISTFTNKITMIFKKKQSCIIEQTRQESQEKMKRRDKKKSSCGKIVGKHILINERTGILVTVYILYPCCRCSAYVKGRLPFNIPCKFMKTKAIWPFL